jgi:hypothetical protein
MSTQGVMSRPDRTGAAPGDVPQVRCCIRCRTPFSSEGFGERICGPCKGTKAWRNPIATRRSHPRGRSGPAFD